MDIEIHSKPMQPPKDWLFNQLVKPSTSQDYHVKNAYVDPDFLADVEVTFPEFKRYIHIKHPNKMPNGRIDPQAKMRVYKQVEQLDDRLFEELTDKHFVTPNDVRIFLMGRHHSGKVYGTKKPYLLSRTDGHTWAAMFDSDITKKQFLQMYSEVARIKKKRHILEGIPKPKPPVNDKLLYAIFKAKQQAKNKKEKLTELQIWSLYDRGELPGYKREKKDSDKQYKSPETLAKFYRNNAPKRYRY